ncbi:MAG: substrate-binding domain-containing protein, partial [bacterium]|nr:substrate-binding domain-containing protein [bacterium]
QGYREALELAGLEVDAALVCHCDFTVGGAAEATRAFVDRDVAFDAVFASDESAIGVLRVLHERGLRCPEEVAVAGCDGLPIGEFTIPKLTTVKLNYGELGRVAVARVVELHEGESIPSRIRLVPELLIRESTPPIEPGED